EQQEQDGAWAGHGWSLRCEGSVWSACLIVLASGAPTRIGRATACSIADRFSRRAAVHFWSHSTYSDCPDEAAGRHAYALGGQALQSRRTRLEGGEQRLHST